MMTRKSFSALAAVAAVAALPLAASGQVSNPDNDSATFFRYQAQAAVSAPGVAALPSPGQLSADGLYVYSGGDRGWINRPHEYVAGVAGSWTHAPACLPHNQPKPVVAIVPPKLTGAFAEHGA